MADMEKKLTFRLLGDTSGLSNALKQAQKETNALGDVMGKIGKIVATTFTVKGIIDFGKQVVKTGMDFEAQMAKVQAISGATAEELKLLEEEARRLGATTMFSATEAGQGLEYFAMAGWSVEDSIAALEPTLRLAQASGEELGVTADIVSDAMTAFGMKANEAGKFTDLLASASTSSNTNVSLLGESFKYVAPLMGAIGASAEDTAYALGLMANAGTKGSQAGTSLRTAITNLLDPTKQMKDAMKQYGVEAKFAEDGSFDLRATLDNLRDVFSQLTPAQQAQAAATIFGKEAMSGMLNIINAAEEDIQKMTVATTDYNGAAEAMSKIMEDNLKGDIYNLKSAWDDLQIELYKKVVPILREIIQWLTEIIRWVTNLESNIKEKFKNNMDTLEKFKEIFDGVKTRIVEIIQTLINTIKEWYERNKENIDNVVEKFKYFLQIVGEVINLVLDIIKMFIDVFTTYFLDKGIAIIKGFTDVFTGIVEVFKGVLQIIKGIFTGDWALIWEGAKSIFSGVWSAIVGVVEGAVGTIKGAINVIIGIVNKFIDGWNKIELNIPSIKLPFGMGRIEGFRVGLPRIPNIPLLAEGGIITRPTLAMIGEGGESEAVVPLSKLDEILGNGGMNGLVVNIYGSVGVEDIGEQLVDTLRRKGVMSFA